MKYLISILAAVFLSVSAHAQTCYTAEKLLEMHQAQNENITVFETLTGEAATRFAFNHFGRPENVDKVVVFQQGASVGVFIVVMQGGCSIDHHFMTRADYEDQKKDHSD